MHGKTNFNHFHNQFSNNALVAKLSQYPDQNSNPKTPIFSFYNTFGCEVKNYKGISKFKTLASHYTLEKL